MSTFRNYRGYQVIIHDEKTGETIAKTNILDHDKQMCTITVDSRCFDSCNSEHVSLLVLCPDTVIEYKGIVRKQSAYEKKEISMYQGHEKEGRVATRYDINAPAKVQGLIISDKCLSLKEALPVSVINISTDGVLIETNSRLLHAGICFQLALTIAGSETIINTTVLRAHPKENGMTECGCKFLSLLS